MLVYFSWIICVLPTSTHTLLAFTVSPPATCLHPQETHAEPSTTTRNEMGKTRNTLRRYWSHSSTQQTNHKDTHKRRSLPRLWGQKKAQEKLLVDRKWSHCHCETEMSQLQTSRTHNARDSLTWTEETELLSTWQAVRLSQTFPKVTQPAPRCHVQFQLSTALAPKITGYCFTTVFSRTAVINLQQNSGLQGPVTCYVIYNIKIEIKEWLVFTFRNACNGN